jgi:hypothetical protein
MSSSDEIPLDEEFVSPPALTHLTGSTSEECEMLDDISVDVAPITLAEPVSREAGRFADFLCRVRQEEEHLGEATRKALVDNRTKVVLQRIFDFVSLFTCVIL